MKVEGGADWEMQASARCKMHIAMAYWSAEDSSDIHKYTYLNIYVCNYVTLVASSC